MTHPMYMEAHILPHSFLNLKPLKFSFCIPAKPLTPSETVGFKNAPGSILVVPDKSNSSSTGKSISVRDVHK